MASIEARVGIEKVVKEAKRVSGAVVSSRWGLPLVYALAAIGYAALPVASAASDTHGLQIIVGCPPSGDDWNLRPHTDLTVKISTANEENRIPSMLQQHKMVALTDVAAETTIPISVKLPGEPEVVFLTATHGGAVSAVNSNDVIIFRPGESYTVERVQNGFVTETVGFTACSFSGTASAK